MKDLIILILRLFKEAFLAIGKLQTSSSSSSYRATWASLSNSSIPPTNLGFSTATSVVLKGEEPLLFVAGGEEAPSSLPIWNSSSTSRLRVFNIATNEWYQNHSSLPEALVEPVLTTTRDTLWLIGGIMVEGGGSFFQETNRVHQYSDSTWTERAPFRVNYLSHGYSVCSSQNIIYLFDSFDFQSLDASNSTAVWKEETTFPKLPAKQFYRVVSSCTSRYGYYADRSNFTGFWRMEFEKRCPSLPLIMAEHGNTSSMNQFHQN